MVTNLATETSQAFSEFRELSHGAENTAESFHSVPAMRDRSADWKSECLDRIERLAELHPDWNSYGAKSVDADSIEVAKALVAGISKVAGIARPRVAASPAGHVALSWESDDQARELDLEILPNGIYRYSYLDEQRPNDDSEREVTDLGWIERLLMYL